MEKYEAIMTFNYANQKQGFRDSYLYNNFAYAVAGLVIEQLSGKEYGTFLKENIFDPLQLPRTTKDILDDTNIRRSNSLSRLKP